MAQGLAVGAPEKNDLQMALFPFAFRENFLEVFFGLLYRRTVGKTPALGETVNVRIHREGGNLERMNHHDAGGLVAYTGQSFELFEGAGNLTVVLFYKNLGQVENVLALGGRKSARLDDFGDFLDAKFDHGLGGLGFLVKFLGDNVDAYVGSLGA